MKTAVVVGASSGIGAAVSRRLASEGYRLLLIARRSELLARLCDDIGNGAQFRAADVTDTLKIRQLVADECERLGRVDLVVISAGTGFINTELEWMPESDTIAVNVCGFAAVATAAMQHFFRQGSGHLVNISSIAALRGSDQAPAYNASKAFASNYMEGLRLKARKAGRSIIVTDVQAGFVDTAMAKGPGLFWVASAEKAAAQIVHAVNRRRSHAYVTRRWRLVAWFLKLAPEWLLSRIG